MSNKRIASQGTSILNREGSTENNEARYDERDRSLINIAELIGIQRRKGNTVSIVIVVAVMFHAEQTAYINTQKISLIEKIRI